MADRPNREYRLPRPMTGEEIREHLRTHMVASWYQEDSRPTQIAGVALTIHWPGSIELGLYSPGAGWTEGIVDEERYTTVRFPQDCASLFAVTPDEW